MILKCGRDKFGSYRIFDNVHNLKYEYRSAKKLSSEIIMEYNSPDTTNLVWENEDCDVGNVIVLEFTSNGKQVIVLSQFEVYLMNDEGKTIEHLRY